MGVVWTFLLSTIFSPLSPSLWEAARYRLKYCRKGPLNPKTTNQILYDAVHGVWFTILPSIFMYRLSQSQGSWVRYPVWQHTFVSPSAFSRRTVVSYWRKYVHEVLVNRLRGLSLPRKSVVRLTDRPDMTLDVYRGRKTTMQQTQSSLNTMALCWMLNCRISSSFVKTFSKKQITNL